MDTEILRHEKVRFRRDEICDLGALPSAVGQQVPRATRKRRQPSRSVRVVLRSFAILALLLVVVVVGLYGLAASGVGTERLRIEAEAALRRAAGPDVGVSIGPARLAFSQNSLLALTIDDLEITNEGGSAISAGTLQFGIRALPLLTGSLKLGSATIADARISVPAILHNRRSDWTQRIRNEDGLIDPDIAGAALFAALHSTFDALEKGGTRQLQFVNTEIVLSEAGRMRSLMINSATLAAAGGELTIAASGALDGRAIELTGASTHDDETALVSNVDVAIDVAPAAELKLDDAGTASQDGGMSRVGAAAIKISASERAVGGAPQVNLTAKLTQSVLDFGKRGVLVGDVDLATTLLVGANKVEFDKLIVNTGRSSFEMTGAVGPEPRDPASTAQPLYRYEFVTKRGSLLPVDSPEQAVGVAARLSGKFDEQEMELTANDLTVSTGQGQIVGRASAQFVRGKTPGIVVALSANDMPVAQIKQFWPWFAGGKPRQWAYQNVFGGTVVDGQVRYRVAPGRIGSGVPLNQDEVSGRFELADSRVDTTGSLPAIRDAYGVVEFRGSDVDVSLSSGNAFVEDGDRVAVSNGTFTLRNAQRPPVIADMEMTIQGNADSVAEIASREPINGFRRLNFLPADLTGQVKGHVKTQVPLQKGIDLRSLNWLVALDFTGLSVAKPFDGQRVTEAKGTLMVDPGQAIVDAQAKLNGTPAELRIVEPLGEGGPARVRDITLNMDEKQRNGMAPGLAGLVTGSTEIKVDASRPDIQELTVDLGKAKLNLPWVGWSKGAGVAGKATFKMKREGASTNLSDFRIDGQSFSATGAIRLAGGNLQSARFDKVQLNRGDSARVDVTRQGNGYRVAVNGSSFDARALIKLLIGDSKGGEAGGGGANTAVALTASIGKLSGFGDETLSGFDLDYRGAANGVATYTASASTKSGGAVSIRNGAEGDRHVMRVQSADAGSLVRFLDIYDKMQGGQVSVALTGAAGGAMRGEVNATNFSIVNEPRLGSIVSSRPEGSDRSLNEAVRRDIDTARVQFERGYAVVQKGNGSLTLDNGILRGPLIGASFQGMLYDSNGNIDMTGTFMPAYGLNRIFGELPLIGALLGNGRDRGLIGVTFKLEGKAAKPRLQINPLSVIAPGFFRQIFEFQ